MTLPTEHHTGPACACVRCGYQTDVHATCAWCDGEVCPGCQEPDAPLCRRCARVVAMLGCSDALLVLP
jgi:hypothetical protein